MSKEIDLVPAASQTLSDGFPGELKLPDAPADQTGAVKAWQEPVVMRTYLPAAPDPNPLFLEKRVYQGSSGRVYPLPVIDRIDTEPVDHTWSAVHLENEFLRFMVLPEIGGRIHVGYDKAGAYDFFYRQNVIKPALVGLAGPWVSGGVEFNWPQHHRPATFMPVEVTTERGDDGSVTVWCSDHDPMSRLKGMHGLCLRPGKAYLELRVRLYNRTADTQTFLWWANVATHVHEKYQSFFPPDVRFAADHAKRAITEFPLCRGTYYGVDYGRRAVEGVATEEQPAHFVPDGSYAPNDLSWYANIPVPTSYMMVGSKGDFSGGYDHARKTGLVYVANHHIAPGKKQWTWGNQEFGYAWDRSLTDNDGPYIELMGGAYTDNQPDFSFLAPGETKAFSQIWYPIQKIGVPDAANVDAALRVERQEQRITVHLMATRDLPDAVIQIQSQGKVLASRTERLAAQQPITSTFDIAHAGDDVAVTLTSGSETILRYTPAEIEPVEQPDVATEPPVPEDVASTDELYLIGVHLEQYRHATRSPEPYWREAVRRDPGDSRANAALGRWHMRRGEFASAEKLLKISIARLTRRNPNPHDGEPHYNLGLVLAYQGRSSEAYEAFYKSTWNAAWRAPAYHRLAEVDAAGHSWSAALEHVERSLRADADNLNARNLKAMLLHRLGRQTESQEIVSETRALDPLDIWSRYLQNGRAPADGQQRLDLAFDLMRAGMLDDAHRVLTTATNAANDGSGAMLLYTLAVVCARLGRETESELALKNAAQASPDYVFPSRLEEMLVLEHAVRENPRDARARYYLGNLLYDRLRHEQAIELWENATVMDPAFPTVWRNLGFAYFNVRHQVDEALHAFQTARTLAPQDARILYEQDQLLKRVGEKPAPRLAALEAAHQLVEQRDDLTAEYARLCNQLDRPEEALRMLLRRKLQPWEGGEGIVLAQYTRAHLLLGQCALERGDAAKALQHFSACLTPPQNLGEAWHLLANRSQIEYWIGAAHEAAEERAAACTFWRRAAGRDGDFVQMEVRPISESTFWSGMSLKRLGKTEQANAIFQKMIDHAAQLDRETPKVDYFATSLPAMLLFDEDLELRQRILAFVLRAQAYMGLGETEQAMRLIETIEKLDVNHSGPSDLRAVAGKTTA